MPDSYKSIALTIFLIFILLWGNVDAKDERFSFWIDMTDQFTIKSISEDGKILSKIFDRPILRIFPNCKINIAQIMFSSVGKDEFEQEDISSFIFPKMDEIAFVFVDDGKLIIKRHIIEDSIIGGGYYAFSPSGMYTAILQSDLGPCHIIETIRLKDYFEKKAKPKFIIDGSLGIAKGDDFPGIESFIEWKTENEVLLQIAFNGEIITIECNIEKNEYKEIGKKKI